MLKRQNRAQRQLEALNKEASNVGLEISDSKTVQLGLNQREDHKLPNLQIEIVDEFKYVGSYVVDIDKDINKSNCLNMDAAFNKLKSILTFRTGKPWVKTKIRLLLRSMHISILYIVWLWNMDAKRKTFQQTRRICNNMLSNYARN